MSESPSESGKYQFSDIADLTSLAKSYATNDQKVRKKLQDDPTLETAWLHFIILTTFFNNNDIDPEEGSIEAEFNRDHLLQFSRPCAEHYDIATDILVDDWLNCLSFR